uniref:Family with sequence similarity 13 member B n=1 Tax=Canis lupus dingo TaxID=286419 RepID=A0A8C0QXH2_CANLU
MRKSSSPSLSNCNSVLANKIFGIPLDELQQGGHPDNEVPFIVRHVVDYIEEHDYNNEDEFGRKLRFLLQQLPPVNYSLLKFLCRFLANVASHHEEIWSANSLAAVFGPDVFHIYTDVEDLKEQEIVSRIMAGLLENYYEFFENEEEDFSSNDLSSITEQFGDWFSLKCVLFCSILERTIRAAVEQHLFDLQSSIDHDLKNLQQQSLVCNNEAEKILKNILKFFFPEFGIQTLSSSTTYYKIANMYLKIISMVGVGQLSIDRHNNTLMETIQGYMLLVFKLIEKSFVVMKCILYFKIQDSSSKICDLNANTESEVPGGQSVGVQGEAACGTQIPHLDLKNVSDGDKWEASCPITFPLIDFKTMHLQRDGEEPFPAFKSWQEDSESGEAQLSPQAGRMNHHPLEEDCPPVLSHRSLDFGQSQRFLHDPETLDSSSKALSFTRIRRSSFSSKDEKREDRTPYQLVKKFQKKIRQFEEQFERERNSKPSYSDIAANPKVLKWMTELTKLRKQIKDAKHKSSDGEFVPQTRPRSNTLPKSFGSSLDHEDEENEDESRVIPKEKKPSKEATLELILKRLKEKRVERCLPEDIKKMTKDHLIEEKTSLQKSLLYYESQHGRPVTREERHIVKPLYERYRLVKQMLTRASITPVLGSPSTKRRGQMLQPIIEGETAHFFEEIKEEEEDGVTLSSELTDILKTAVQAQSSLENSESDVEENPEKLALDLRLSSTRAASMPELLEQLWKARAEKKKLRKTLREFEEAFYQQNGRNAQKEDRVPVLEEYREYKKIKAKLRLLEVLISKQDSSKSI